MFYTFDSELPLCLARGCAVLAGGHSKHAWGPGWLCVRVRCCHVSLSTSILLHVVIPGSFCRLNTALCPLPCCSAAHPHLLCGLHCLPPRLVPAQQGGAPADGAAGAGGGLGVGQGEQLQGPGAGLLSEERLQGCGGALAGLSGQGSELQSASLFLLHNQPQIAGAQARVSAQRGAAQVEPSPASSKGGVQFQEVEL